MDYSQRTSTRHPRPLQATPTSQKQGSNERGQTWAVLTGGTRSRGKGKKVETDWWQKGKVGSSKWQGISHIMAFRVPYRVSPGWRGSGHRAADPCLPINTPPYLASMHVWMFSSWKIITQQQILFVWKCAEEKKSLLLWEVFVCLLLLVTKVNMSMAQAGKPMDRIHRTTMKWKNWSTGDVY